MATTMGCIEMMQYMYKITFLAEISRWPFSVSRLYTSFVNLKGHTTSPLPKQPPNHQQSKLCSPFNTSMIFSLVSLLQLGNALHKYITSNVISMASSFIRAVGPLLYHDAYNELSYVIGWIICTICTTI